MLTVNTFGKFQITDGEAIIDDNNLNSIMLSKLLMYILLYRDKTLSTEDIVADIWREEEVENPNGALKNLVYRLRKILNKYFGDTEFIITNRGSYKWNDEVKVVIDNELFEKLIGEAKVENVYEQAIVKYEQAVDLYNGFFMSKLLDLHWIMTLNTYYHSMYLSAVKALAELYIKTEKYEKLEVLCTQAIHFESGDEQLYCYQIEARMRSGKISLALDSYEKAREIMEKELGVRKTTVLNKVYQELLSMNKGSVTYNINEVHDDIVQENPIGVFLCGYPIFKEIYHLESRKAIRSGEPENLVLLTLESKIEDEVKELSEYRIKQAMVVLEQTLKECLRVGDVAAKYSESQFIILLPTCTYDLALLVANRIIALFYDKEEKLQNIRIRINVEGVSSADELIEKRNSTTKSKKNK